MWSQKDHLPAFFVSWRRSMTRPQLVINLYGGVVQDVFSAVPGLQVLLVDWDVEDAFPGEPSLVEVPLPHGARQACVGDLQVSSLDGLAGTDVEAAVDAAYQQGVLGDRAPV
jgi:hypothetical protein